MKVKFLNKYNIEIPDKYAKNKSSYSKQSLVERLESGAWEKEEITLLSKYIFPDDNVLEIGACIGALSVVTNDKLSKTSKHTVVEANPNLIKTIEKNKKNNNCSFDVLNIMIDDPAKNNGDFYVHNFILASSTIKKNHKNSKLVKIEVKPLSDYFDHNFLILDIEGSEYQFIENFKKDLTIFKKLLIEFHILHSPVTLRRTAIENLKHVGFNLIESINDVYYFER